MAKDWRFEFVSAEILEHAAVRERIATSVREWGFGWHLNAGTRSRDELSVSALIDSLKFARDHYSITRTDKERLERMAVRLAVFGCLVQRCDTCTMTLEERLTSWAKLNLPVDVIPDGAAVVARGLVHAFEARRTQYDYQQDLIGWLIRHEKRLLIELFKDPVAHRVRNAGSGRALDLAQLEKSLNVSASGYAKSLQHWGIEVSEEDVVQEAVIALVQEGPQAWLRQVAANDVDAWANRLLRAEIEWRVRDALAQSFRRLTSSAGRSLLFSVFTDIS